MLNSFKSGLLKLSYDFERIFNIIDNISTSVLI